jgi:hypothetical protein
MATETAKAYASNATPPMATGRLRLRILAVQKTSGFTGGQYASVSVDALLNYNVNTILQSDTFFA